MPGQGKTSGFWPDTEGANKLVRLESLVEPCGV